MQIDPYTAVAVLWIGLSAVLSISCIVLAWTLRSTWSKSEGYTALKASLTRTESDLESLMHKVDQYGKRLSREKRKESSSKDDEEPVPQTADDLVRIVEAREHHFGS